MQKFDGKGEGRFDGSPPDPYTPPSWRGVLFMLVVIGIFLALIAYAFLTVIAQPGAPDFSVPITLPR